MKRYYECRSLVVLFMAFAVCLADEPASSKSTPTNSITTKTSCQFDHSEAKCKRCNRPLGLCHCRENWQLVCEWLSYRPESTEGLCCLKNMPSGCHPPLYLFFLNNCSRANACGRASPGCVNGSCPKESLAKASKPAATLVAHAGKDKIAKKTGRSTGKPTTPESAVGMALVTWEEPTMPGPQSCDTKCSGFWMSKLDPLGLFSRPGFPKESRSNFSSMNEP